MKVGALLPPSEAARRGSQVIHGAPMLTYESRIAGTFEYPRLRSFCGVECRAEATGCTVEDVTCRRCWRSIVWLRDARLLDDAATAVV